MYKAILCVLVISMWCTACAAEGLSTLIEVGRSQADIQKAYDDETKAFERVKRAAESGALKKGMTKEAVGKEFGEPVVAYVDYKRKQEKWVYKPASSTFFGGIRISIFFTDAGVVDDITTQQ